MQESKSRHLFEPFQNILPPPIIAPHQLRPSLIIVLRTPRPYTEIDGRTAAQTFPPTAINLPPRKVFLGDGLVTPIVTGSSLECPVPFAKPLMAGIGIGAASVQQEDLAIGQRPGEAGG